MVRIKMPLPSAKTAILRTRHTIPEDASVKRADLRIDADIIARWGGKKGRKKEGQFKERKRYIVDSRKESVSLPAKKTVASKAALKSARYDDN